MKKASNRIAKLESVLLKRVRAGQGLSRVDLSRELNLQPSTIGLYVNRLIQKGLLVESHRVSRRLGRRPTVLELRGDGGQFVGVDFEARNIIAMSVDFSQQPMKTAHKTIEESDPVERILKKIEQAISEVLPDLPHRVLAIGVGVPGLLDPVKGMALYYEYIKGWENIPLGSRLTDKFGVPVYLENNIRSMALAELWFGHERGEENFVCVGIRSGIAAGIVVNGHLYRGSQNSAGEIGRWRCPLVEGRHKRGALPVAGPELQEVASVRAMVGTVVRAIQRGEKTLLASSAQPVTIQDIIHACQQGDALSRRILETAAAHLGWAISQLTLLMDPTKVILAGPLAPLGELFLNPVKKLVEQIAGIHRVKPPVVVYSTLGESSGALGAAALAVHEWKPAR